MTDTPKSKKSLELDTPAEPSGEFEKDIEKSTAQPEQALEPVNPRAHLSKWRWVSLDSESLNQLKDLR
jgi:hypothetical protein